MRHKYETEMDVLVMNSTRCVSVIVERLFARLCKS